MTEINSILQAGIASLLVIFIGLVKIPPLQINFWGWLGKIIGETINGEVLKQVGDLTNELNNFKEQQELENVRGARQRILHFCDEILFKQRHSKEHFDEILEDIDVYEKYCREHKDYENNRAELAISTIREVYKQCLKTHDFLSYTQK